MDNMPDDVFEYDGQILYNCIGYPGYYVTKSGDVFSLFKIGGHGVNGLQYIHKLKFGYDKDGYRRLIFCRHGKRCPIKVHTLVVERFIGPVNPPLVVNHKDGNKTNNCVDNLEIVTVKENTNHAILNNLFSKFTPVEVEYNGDTYRFAAKALCTKQFPDLSRHYLDQLENGIILFSMVDFQKQDPNNRHSPIDCYYNGRLYMTFPLMRECDKYFHQSIGATSGAIRSAHEYRRKINQYHVTFPNVSTIESAD